MYCQTKCPDLTTLLASEGYLFFVTVFSQFDISELTKFSCIYVKFFTLLVPSGHTQARHLPAAGQVNHCPI